MRTLRIEITLEKEVEEEMERDEEQEAWTLEITREGGLNISRR